MRSQTDSIVTQLISNVYDALSSLPGIRFVATKNTVVAYMKGRSGRMALRNAWREVPSFGVTGLTWVGIVLDWAETEQRYSGSRQQYASIKADEMLLGVAKVMLSDFAADAGGALGAFLLIDVCPLCGWVVGNYVVGATVDQFLDGVRDSITGAMDDPNWDAPVYSCVFINARLVCGYVFDGEFRENRSTIR